MHREREMHNPRSVASAMLSRQFTNYWNQTETYEALRQYIDGNFEGLKEHVVILMDGVRIAVDITGHHYAMATFRSKDDILTPLIHLGCLGCWSETEEVFTPNLEVPDVFRSSANDRSR